MNRCIISGEGGGGGSSGAGFLGIQWIDDNCWKDVLAEQESNADLKARLKCGESKFRGSVAGHEVPGLFKKRERTIWCIDYTKEIYLAEIEFEKQQAEWAHKQAVELLTARERIVNSGN